MKNMPDTFSIDHKKTFSNQNTKNPSCVCAKCALWYESIPFMETLTCQCWQLKLNPLSMQINIYCLMTNQTPALLVQHAP